MKKYSSSQIGMPVLLSLLLNGPSLASSPGDQALSVDGLPLQAVQASGNWRKQPFAVDDQNVGNVFVRDASGDKLSILLPKTPVSAAFKSLLRSAPHVLTANEKSLLAQNDNPWVVRYVAERGTPQIVLLSGHSVMYNAFAENKRMAIATDKGRMCVPATDYEVHVFLMTTNGLMEVSLVRSTGANEEKGKLDSAEQEFKKIFSSIVW